MIRCISLLISRARIYYYYRRIIHAADIKSETHFIILVKNPYLFFQKRFGGRHFVAADV